MQVLQCISCINHLANIIEQSACKTLPWGFSSPANTLEHQLDTLQQVPQIIEDSNSGKLEEAQIMRTAELYRVAALMYFHQSVTRKQFGSSEMQTLIELAFSTLSALDICTSPWPLFIIACEVVWDEQRVTILGILEKMQKERRIGNVEIMRNIIEAVWKRADILHANDTHIRVNWKDLVDTTRQIPSFI